MQELDARDYFTDYEILKDPYAYFEAVRVSGPIYKAPGRDYLVVTGYDEILEVLKNNDDFSAIIALQGAGAPLPFSPQGSDISAEVEAHRTQFLGSDLLINYDDKHHSYVRSLISALFTPSRLKANEEFIAKYSEELVHSAVSRGRCDLMWEIATPFVTLVVADLLGVPADDRQLFMDVIDAAPPPGSLDRGQNELSAESQVITKLVPYFAEYVRGRRASPRQDVLSELANAKYPDGSVPDVGEVVRLAFFLFGAGQDTSAKLLGNAMRFIVEQPGLQSQLRSSPGLIPKFIEEVLRLEGSTKQTARLARRDTRIGGYSIAAGTKLMLALAAGNRDPRAWPQPEAFVLDRPRIREHIAFGRGKHVCAGAPLARVEIRMILEKFLACTSEIELDESKHGPSGARTLDYEPSFIIRGLANLHLTLTPASDFVAVQTTMPVRKPPGAAGAKPQPTRYSTADSDIGALLANPLTKAVVDKHLPGVTDDPRFAMAAAMTLRAVQAFAPEQFSNETLDAIDRELSGVAMQS